MLDSHRQCIFDESARQEESRLRFLEENRGHDKAVAFARRTLAIYRRAVVKRTAPAGDATFRLRLLASYCFLKRYLGKPRHSHMRHVTANAREKPRLACLHGSSAS